MTETNFFQHLESKGLIYPIKTIENFLLSLKAKQFVILSGGSGSGKTSLAKAYAVYVAGTNENDHTLTLETTLSKKSHSESEGNPLHNSIRDPKELYSMFPVDHLNGRKFPLRIGDIETSCRINLSPRVVIDSADKDRVKEEIERIKNDPTIEKPEYNGRKYLRLNITVEKGGAYKLVPVGSNWTENRHILGYYNLIEKKYKPEPAYELMKAADDNPSRTYVLILDEMNLSHVERYFSDILSAMESRESIEIDDHKGTELNIGNNLIIIGTVNQDETTYTFSPKVLDRANVIEFPPSNIDDMLNGTSYVYKPEGDVEFLEDPRNRDAISTKDVKEILREISGSNGGVEAIQEIQSTLKDLQKRLEDIGFGFGFRTVQEIMRFMYAAWMYERKDLSGKTSRYLDAQIMQKILPKIHGNNSIMDTLNKLSTFCGEKYPCSKEKLEKMIKVLKTQRYVSFNC